ncbi:HCLS1-associated protein X-1 [Rhincodon typus]|uniref:HCLS1-associated protein X-1 n=1 Tax=Rhincodon typus TaxID=259920 RepID=UPI00202E40D7|nr:HCLS1-associated protein X-1 [Rhincodon typus]
MERKRGRKKLLVWKLPAALSGQGMVGGGGRRILVGVTFNCSATARFYFTARSRGDGAIWFTARGRVWDPNPLYGRRSGGGDNPLYGRRSKPASPFTLRLEVGRRGQSTLRQEVEWDGGAAMSLFGLFRGFFGFPERGDGRGDRFFQGMTLDDEDEDEDEDEDDGFFGARPGDTFSFGFRPGGRNFDDGFSGLFHEMDELFKGIGSWEVPSGQFDLPVLEPHPYGGGRQEWSRRSPRDLMLKEPEKDRPEGSGEQPDGDRRDRLTPEGSRRGPLTPYRRPWNPPNTVRPTSLLTQDQEEAIQTHQAIPATRLGYNLAPLTRFGSLPLNPPAPANEIPSACFPNLLRNSPAPCTLNSAFEGKGFHPLVYLDSRVNSEGLDKILKPSEPQTRSYFKSVSVSKVVLPDGSVEERRVTRDGEGNEETTVTRAHGEQSYTTVTRRDAQGKEERTEEMVNMDDSERQRFTEHWEHRPGKDTPSELQTFGDSLSFLDKLLKGIFSR